MSLSRCLVILLLAVSTGCEAQRATRVPIVVTPGTSPGEQIAAADLASSLERLHPDARFPLVTALPADGPAIVVGSVDSSPAVADQNKFAPLAGPGSFKVSVCGSEGRQVGVIAGADPAGAIRGVYALLEKLGYGFFLSGDAAPAQRAQPFSFEQWNLADAPLVQDRVVFNWHNFLSGCSSWNLDHWKTWISQSQKMGFNGIMVHAYGNNPMAGFAFNGIEKPVGYLTTTRSGRDWSTQHVNDVRQLFGGEVFDSPVFGSEAAIVPNEQRVAAARKLMRETFAEAGRRAMHVWLAVDVDTASANPQEIIQALPPAARFAVKVQTMKWMNQESSDFWLPNPDSPQGYAYYKAQVQTLLETYPQVDRLVPWFRHEGTPWMGMKLEEMPPAWQAQYKAELARTPGAEKFWRSHNFFAMGKVLSAFQKALAELGRKDVVLGTGTWRFDCLEPADRFFPGGLMLIPLDYEVLHDRSQLDSLDRRVAIRKVAQHRPVMPVVWAHHDDGNYVGRPYTPYENFAWRLADCATPRFGIIHWTTRPLDLYFKSLANQVWKSTEDQPLQATCQQAAATMVGPSAGRLMGVYLYDWLVSAPKIGRDTSDFFIDRKLTDFERVKRGFDRRMKLLAGIDVKSLQPSQRDRIAYFQGLERFIIGVYECEAALQKARDFHRAGDFDAARRALAEAQPQKVIQQYAATSQLGGITRGEQGLVVSLNTRWYTHYLALRQVLGMESVRINFGPTSHDPLAQAPGRYTFFVDHAHQFWQTLGQAETSAPAFVIRSDARIAPPADASPTLQAMRLIYDQGVVVEKPLTIVLGPVMQDAMSLKPRTPMTPGKYKLTLCVLADPGLTFEAVIAAAQTRKYRISTTGQSRGTTTEVFSFDLELTAPGKPQVTVAPAAGKLRLCGMLLQPLSTSVAVEPTAARP